jgi:16S rRNA (uracil1498-N3)-methyltransferase
VATLHRFYLEGLPAAGGGAVELPPRIARQVAAVLRLRPGDPLVVFDGSGGEWTAELCAVGRRGSAARLLEHRPLHTEPALRVTLCPALLKADHFDWVLQKGTELGVAEFRPIVTDRVVAADRRDYPGGAGRDHSAERGAPRAKFERWQRIVMEAAEQSGRAVVPRVHPPAPLATALRRHCGARLVCWEGERCRPFVDALGQALAADARGVDLYIGPEGGFTPEEARAAAEAGAQTVSLGPRTLRSETAAVAAVALALLSHTPPPLPLPGGLPGTRFANGRLAGRGGRGPSGADRCSPSLPEGEFADHRSPTPPWEGAGAVGAAAAPPRKYTRGWRRGVV